MLLSVHKSYEYMLPALVVFFITIAYIPMVETSGLMSNSMTKSRLIEIGLLLASAILITGAIIHKKENLQMYSSAAYISLMYGIWAFISGFWSPSNFLAFGKAAELLITTYSAILLGLYLREDGKENNSNMIVISTGLVLTFIVLVVINLAAVGSPFRFTEASDWSGRKQRLFLGYSHPLETAEFLALLGFSLYMTIPNHVLKLIAASSVFILIYMTDARNVIIFYPVIVALLVYLHGSIQVKVFMVCGLIAGFAFIAVFLINGDIQRLLPYDFWTLNNRVPLWLKSIEFIGQNPILGVGYFSGRFFLQEYFSFAATAHNSFVEAALTTGLVGLGMLIYYLCYSTFIAVKNNSKFLISLLVFIILASVFNPIILIPNITSFLLIFCVVSSAESLSLRNKNNLSQKIENTLKGEVNVKYTH